MPSNDLNQLDLVTFPGGSVVQLVGGHPTSPDALVAPLHQADVELTATTVTAREGDIEWSWLLEDLEAVHHGADEPWTILMVAGVADHGVSVRSQDVDAFRSQLAARVAVVAPSTPISVAPRPVVSEPPALTGPAPISAGWATARAPIPQIDLAPTGSDPTLIDAPVAVLTREAEPRGSFLRRALTPRAGTSAGTSRVGRPAPLAPAPLEARDVSAWFGSHNVLDRVSLLMPAGQVTALIGPSGCGKSTFLRILNRMHELIPSAALAGEVLLDGEDIYEPSRKITDARRQIGMVFQKPNPFPAMSIYDNVIASLRLTGTKATTAEKDEMVESCLSKAGLWNEVRDRLRQPGGGLSGGQQQRLCIARALAIRPRVLLMDEPCSALDPTSTRRIEQTISELAAEVTIVIVTHNMQQAMRVSDRCAFFLAEQGTPGVIVEHGPTDLMFGNPQDPRTSDYVTGRFG